MVCCHVPVKQRSSEWDSLYDFLPMIMLVTAISLQV